MIKIAGCRRGQPPGNVIGRILAVNFHLLCIGISTVLQSFVICREKQKKSRAGAKKYKFRSCCHLESWFTPTTCDKHLVLKSESGSSSDVFKTSQVPLAIIMYFFWVNFCMSFCLSFSLETRSSFGKNVPMIQLGKSEKVCPSDQLVAMFWKTNKQPPFV